MFNAKCQPEGYKVPSEQGCGAGELLFSAIKSTAVFQHLVFNLPRRDEAVPAAKRKKRNFNTLHFSRNAGCAGGYTFLDVQCMSSMRGEHGTTKNLFYRVLKLRISIRGLKELLSKRRSSKTVHSSPSSRLVYVVYIYQTDIQSQKVIQTSR